MHHNVSTLKSINKSPTLPTINELHGVTVVVCGVVAVAALDPYRCIFVVVVVIIEKLELYYL